jgi:hypothetical protein
MNCLGRARRHDIRQAACRGGGWGSRFNAGRAHGRRIHLAGHFIAFFEQHFQIIGKVIRLINLVLDILADTHGRGVDFVNVLGGPLGRFIELADDARKLGL